jgi:hypothetical protein
MELIVEINWNLNGLRCCGMVYWEDVDWILMFE